MAERLHVKVISWGDPEDESGTIYWGLKINGAYLGRPGDPVLWATKKEALQAKRDFLRVDTIPDE